MATEPDAVPNNIVAKKKSGEAPNLHSNTDYLGRWHTTSKPETQDELQPTCEHPAPQVRSDIKCQNHQKPPPSSKGRRVLAIRQIEERMEPSLDAAIYDTTPRSD